MRKLNLNRFTLIATVALMTPVAAMAIQPAGTAKNWPATNLEHRTFFCGSSDRSDNTMPVGYGAAISKEMKKRVKAGATDGQAIAHLRQVAACEGEMKQVGVFIELDSGSAK